MKKRVSLNRMIIEMMGVAYAIILILLFVMTGYLRSNYKVTMQTKWQNAMDAILLKTENELESINSQVLGISTNNSNFEALATETDIECYKDINLLYDYLKKVEINKGKGHGYILYYDNLSKRAYYFKNGYFNNKTIEAMKDYVQTIALSETESLKWFYFSLEGKEYALLLSKNNNVAYAEIYDLGINADRLLNALNITGAKIYYTNAGKTFSGEDMVFLRDDLLFSRDISGSPLQMKLYIPDDFWTYFNISQSMVILAIIISITIAFFAYSRLKEELFHPLEQMQAELIRIGKGDMDSHISSSSRFEELQQMIDTVNVTLDEVEKQRYMVYEQSLERQKTLSQYLSMQLKPHFYLNGLKTLNVYALNGDTQKIQSIIMRLSDHLRSKLQVERLIVTLVSEIEYVENYVALQRDMTDRPININWYVQEELKACLVPNLCIQTFVENSIKYAKLGNVYSELNITITINKLDTEDGRFIDICVLDNGMGYDEDVLNIINGDAIEESRCIGINNLKRRCKLLYEGWSDYYFTNDNGAMSDLIVPWREADYENTNSR